MPAITYQVEIAFESSPMSEPDSADWTDVTAFVLWHVQPIRITRGRHDEQSQPQTGKCSVVLDNTDGRFTPGNSNSPYHPNVRLGKLVRVSALEDRIPFYPRFTGYIDGLVIPDWAQSPAHKIVQLAASCLLKQIANRTALRSVTEEQVAFVSPDGYFPLGEPEGSAAAYSAIPGIPPMLPALSTQGGGTLSLGKDSGLDTDNLPSPLFEPSIALDTSSVPDIIGSTHLASQIPPVAYGASPFAEIMIQAWFRIQEIYPHFPPIIASLHGQYTADIIIDSTNHHIYGSLMDVPPSEPAATVVGPIISPDTTYHVVLTAAVGEQMTLYVNGEQFLGDPSPSFDPSLDADSFTVGEDFHGTIAHAAYHTNIPQTSYITDIYRAGATGFADDTTDELIRRIAMDWLDYNGFTYLDTGISSIAAATDIANRSVLDVLRDIETVEYGLLLAHNTGQLRFLSRASRFNVTDTIADFTVAGDEILGGLQFIYDDQHITNHMEVTRRGGATAVARDDTSVANYGIRQKAVTIAVADDNQSSDRANYIVNTQAEPAARMTNLSFDPLTHTSPGLLLARSIGDLIGFVGLTSDSPQGTSRVWIEGITEEISAGRHIVTLHTSPDVTNSQTYWQLGDTTWSQLGTATRLAY